MNELYYGSIICCEYFFFIFTATCGGTIRGQSGYIQSPNFPSPYDSNSDCEWYIHGPTGHYLTFNFLNFNLQYGSNCTVVDYIEIREYNATGKKIFV